MITGARERIINYRKNHPYMTLEAIGINVGVTKERVRQILHSENLETRSVPRIPDPMPGCRACGKPVNYRRRIFCSSECQFPLGKTHTNCHHCNIEITLMTSVYNSRMRRAKFIHCSRPCRDNTRRGTPLKAYKTND